MKKTLIALMALAGVTAALESEFGWTAADFKTNMNTFIEDSGYQAGDSFTLKLTIADTGGLDAYRSGMLLHLATNNDKTWGIYSQAGAYIAMENTTTDDRTWTAPTTQDLTTGVFEWTSTESTFASLLDSWVSYQTTLNKDNNYRSSPGLESISIVVDSTGSSITLGMLNGTSSVIKTAYILDANQIAMGTKVTGKSINETSTRIMSISNGSFTVGSNTYSIPEPTTATLSLLALAGLAARRRRR